MRSRPPEAGVMHYHPHHWHQAALPQVSHLAMLMRSCAAGLGAALDSSLVQMTDLVLPIIMRYALDALCGGSSPLLFGRRSPLLVAPLCGSRAARRGLRRRLCARLHPNH